MARVPLHYRIAAKIMELMKYASTRKMVYERMNGTVIEQVESADNGFHTGGEIFISNASVYKDLSPAAIKIIIEIQEELVMNNPLWECKDKSKAHTRLALAQLKQKGIIEAIDETDIFIVNPAMIRKGRPLAIYGALYDYAERQYTMNKHWKVTTEDIKRFVAPKSVNIIAGLIEPDLPRAVDN